MSEPRQFRKRPLVIEAMEFRFEPEGTEMIVAAWCKGRLRTTDPSDGYWLEIETLEGTMCADPGDWIIKGVKGEFYPCKPDIFEATYEAVTPSAGKIHIESEDVAGVRHTENHCDFGRYDEDGNALEECWRRDYELIEVHDDVVRLCPKHRSWAAAMGKP